MIEEIKNIKEYRFKITSDSISHAMVDKYFKNIFYMVLDLLKPEDKIKLYIKDGDNNGR